MLNVETSRDLLLDVGLTPKGECCATQPTKIVSLIPSN